MSGQDEDELISDLEAAVSMGSSNIDIYPIDNIMTQVGLHKKLEASHAQPTSAMRKFSMNVLVDQFMRSSGFTPHNGHGYVRTNPTPDIVTDKYSFAYHEHVYGYHDFDLLGFGTNAVTSTKGHVITNVASRQIYQNQIATGQFACTISQHEATLDYSRPVILRLAYHGEIEKRLVHWDKVHPTVLLKLEELKKECLVTEIGDKIRLTKLGWYWYVDIMYYLMPREDQLVMNRTVVDQIKNTGRSFTKTELLYPQSSQRAAA